MPPGRRALAFARNWFDPTTVHRVFEPLIADWQREWQDAAPSRRARISLRGLAAFICATIVSSPGIVLTPTPSAVANRVTAHVARFTLSATVLLFVPLASVMETGPISGALILLIPGLVVLVFPFAVIGAVDTIRNERQLSPQQQRTTALKLAFVAMTLLLCLGGWALPAANQAWRVAMNPHRPAAPARGVRELTTWELVAHPERATAPEHPVGVGKRSSDPSARADGIRRELNSRASMILLPALLLWRRWSVLTLASGFSPLPSWLVALATAFVFLLFRFNDWFVEQILNLPAGAAAWLPLMILGTAAMIRIAWARRLINQWSYQ